MRIMTQIIPQLYWVGFLYRKSKKVFLIILFSVLLILLIYLLLMPIVLCINTITDQYYLQVKGLARANIEGDKEEFIRIRLKVFFLNFNFYPLRKPSPKKIKQKGVKVKKHKKRIGFNKVLKLLKSFKVKRFLLNIDTGNCITNAKLYPVFAFLNYRIGGFNINFQGKNQLVLHMQNRPIHIIKSFIKF